MHAGSGVLPLPSEFSVTSSRPLSAEMPTPPIMPQG